MDKYNIKHIRVELENGTVIEHSGGTFIVSKNARKKGGFVNLQEWDEFHITWIKYHEEAKPVEEVVVKEKPPSLYSAWCSIHSCPPSDCFTIHNPDALGASNAM